VYDLPKDVLERGCPQQALHDLQVERIRHELGLVTGSIRNASFVRKREAVIRNREAAMLLAPFAKLSPGEPSRPAH